MGNPAFELYEDGTGGTGDGTGGATTDTDSGAGVCELDFEALRLVRYLIPENVVCQELLDTWMVAVEVTPDGLVLEGPCTPGCAECEDRGAVLLGSADDSTGAVPACLHFHNERPFPAETPDRCNWGGTTIRPEGDSDPLVVLSAAAYGIPGDASEFLAGHVIDTERLDECECIESEGCCNAARPPEMLKLLIDDLPVHERESVTVDVGGRQYLFTNSQSHSTGECGEPAHIGWSLVLQP